MHNAVKKCGVPKRVRPPPRNYRPALSNVNIVKDAQVMRPTVDFTFERSIISNKEAIIIAHPDTSSGGSIIALVLPVD